MIRLKYVPLVLRHIARNRTRTLLTVFGVAIVMFLYVAVQAMQAGVRDATARRAGDATLIVYRQNRYCPSTSRLPEHYLQRILQINGVASAVPVRIEVSNCRTALDVVTFRGVPPELFLAQNSEAIQVRAGSIEAWRGRGDAALVGEALARRRGLSVGDRFEAVGINVYVAGIIDSDQPQDQNVAYVHLPFLQQSSGGRQLGVVTQFVVRASEPKRLDEVARAIDAEFRSDPEPTQTSSEKAFVGRAAGDVINIVSYTRWLGWGCVLASVALIANAIVLSVQDRIRDHAVLQTLGYPTGLIARLLITESATIGLMGGALGTVAALAAAYWSQLAISSEGLSILMTVRWPGVVAGLGLSLVLGVVAGMVPAWQAARREITTCFRAV